MEKKDQGPSPFREATTFPPQADHVLVVLFFIVADRGAALKPPRHLAPAQGQGHRTGPEDFRDLHGPEASSHHRQGFIRDGPGGLC